MLATESSAELEMFSVSPAAKKFRMDSTPSSDPTQVERSIIRNLELEGVKELFQDYDLLDTEACACVICGKKTCLYFLHYSILYLVILAPKQQES